jgi:coatomer subunit beta'
MSSRTLETPVSTPPVLSFCARLENTLNYALERVWALAYIKGSNRVAIGYDEGTIMIKIGREEPVASMDNSGKIIWAKHSEIQTVNVKAVPADVEVSRSRLTPGGVQRGGSWVRVVVLLLGGRNIFS